MIDINKHFRLKNRNNDSPSEYRRKEEGMYIQTLLKEEVSRTITVFI